MYAFQKNYLDKTRRRIKITFFEWIKTQDVGLKNFYWQNGYGAFSVNPTEIDRAQQYIESQQEHHKTTSFQDEYRAFLNKYKGTFEERYVWD